MPVFSMLNILGLISFSMAGYVLEDDYMSDTFFSMFDFFTDDDPTHGYVNYVDQKTAQSQGLIGERDGAAYVGVDYKDIAQGRGRNSVRLTSKKAYNYGLIVLDLKHMPGGQCGTWPAFWMLGPDWPNGGEIDIIEGVNSQTSNDHTLHTGRGCTVHDTGAFSGELRTADCDVNAPGQYANIGCRIESNDTATYGRGFGLGDGGVYATEWSRTSISVWYFPRDAIPVDLPGDNPDPLGWGMPNAKFEGGCDMDKHLRDHSLVFDVTFCGDWAGRVWGQDSICSTEAPSCQEFVQNNPSAFEDTNWQIRNLRVYRLDESDDRPVDESATMTSHEYIAHLPPLEESLAVDPEEDSAHPPAVEEASSSKPEEASTHLPAVEEAVPSKAEENGAQLPAIEETAPLRSEDPIASPPAVEEVPPIASEEGDEAAPPEAPSEPAMAKETRTLQALSQLRIPEPTVAPQPPTKVVSIPNPHHKTVSALQWAHFGSPTQNQRKNNRYSHARRLPRHPRRGHR